MNVDAKIIINSAINVLSVPERTLYESDGTNALVITNSNSAEEDAVMNPAEYPNINVPEGYKLVKVQYGVSDGTNVEIISGLSVQKLINHKVVTQTQLMKSLQLKAIMVKMSNQPEN